MQKARCHSRSCSNRLQAYGFRVYFTPLFTVLFTFPSRYQSTIGLSGVFSLTRWSWQFQTGFHVPRPTQDTAITYLSYLYGTITLYGHAFPRCSNSINSKYRSPTTPALPKQYRFGLLPFRSPLLWESLLFSSPPPTQMFQFSGFAHLYDVVHLQCTGLPHSDICVSTRMCQSTQLFAAYHVLLRL